MIGEEIRTRVWHRRCFSGDDSLRSKQILAERRWQAYHITPLIDSNSAEYQKKDAEYRAAEKVFVKHLFAFAVPLGRRISAYPGYRHRTDVRWYLQCLRWLF